jgi:hypothetical protein
VSLVKPRAHACALAWIRSDQHVAWRGTPLFKHQAGTEKLTFVNFADRPEAGPFGQRAETLIETAEPISGSPRNGGPNIAGSRCCAVSSHLPDNDERDDESGVGRL